MHLPQTNGLNATRQWSKCHTSIPQMPHVSPAELWHFTYWVVAFGKLRCGISNEMKREDTNRGETMFLLLCKFKVESELRLRIQIYDIEKPKSSIQVFFFEREVVAERDTIGKAWESFAKDKTFQAFFLIYASAAPIAVLPAAERRRFDGKHTGGSCRKDRRRNRLNGRAGPDAAL